MTTIYVSAVRGNNSTAEVERDIRSVLRKYGSVKVTRAWNIPITYFRCRLTAVFEDDLPESALIAINKESFNGDSIKAHRPFCPIPLIADVPSISRLSWKKLVLMLGVALAVFGSIAWVLWPRSIDNDKSSCEVTASVKFSMELLIVRRLTLDKCQNSLAEKKIAAKQKVNEKSKFKTIEIAVHDCWSQWWVAMQYKMDLNRFELAGKALFLQDQVSACKKMSIVSHHPATRVGSEVDILENDEPGLALRYDNLQRSIELLEEEKEACFFEEGITDDSIQEALKVL